MNWLKELNRQDALIGVGIVLIAIGVGAYDWRIAVAVTGVFLLSIGLFYG